MLFALVATLLMAPAPSSSEAANAVREGAPPRVYQAVRTVDTIVVDGKRNEKTWSRAAEDDRFLERSPLLGQVPPVRTSVSVAYDDVALYVFIDASSEPGDVVVRTLRRDNPGIFADDAVYVKVDPTFTKRNAYSLGVNADGAQIDALGLEDGRDFVREWDGVWQAETVRRDDGYTAEFRIPFAVLGIRGADDQTVGFNISRDHPSRNATYDWRVLVPPRSPMAASQFGEVRGLSKIPPQLAIEYTPYALARSNFEPDFSMDPARRPNIATGADARVQIGAGSYVEASVLTDFAQVEADEVQVARDRFPLFFPERRPFFINGLDIFNFGRAGEAQLFFTRRVGLVGGTVVPILGGLKVYGRNGSVSYGLLQVQTLGSPEAPSRGVAASQPESLSVGRVRIQATNALNVGLMALGQHRFGESDVDTAAGGIDTQIQGPDGRLAYYGFIAGTFSERPPVQLGSDESDPLFDPSSEIGSSAHSLVEYRGLYVRPSLFWLWSDDDFDPRLGFYRRPGSTRQEARINFAPRPQVFGLREITFGPAYSVETTPSYDARLGQQGSARTQLNWNNGSRLGYEVAHFVDDVQTPFELYLYTVEAQRYTGFRHRVDAAGPQRRWYEVSGSYEFIELFGGTAHQPSLSVTGKFGKHVTARARYTHLVGRLAEEEERFNFGFANANLDFALTRNLAFDNLLRLDLSPANERVGVQSRLRWRFAPGSDIFFVYRTDQPLGLDQVELSRSPFHEVTVKFSYYLRAILTRG